MKILIAGYGNIGKHTREEFKNIPVEIFDKYKGLRPIENPIESTYFDFAFICVPTEMKEDGSADVSEVEWCIKNIRAFVYIVKSAVPVGTWKKLGVPSVVISPEYYGTTQHSLESPHFLILGGNQPYCDEVQNLYSKVKDGSFRYIFTTPETAELAKYMENCWIATKVTFCNEFAKIAKRFGISYPELRECFIADERVNPSHTYVYKEKPFFDSHCLNKDIPALITFCKEAGVETPLMKTVLEIKKQNENNFRVQN